MSILSGKTIGERFAVALHASARSWRRLLDKRLKHLGISQAGWMTITVIARAGEPLSQRALADLVDVEGPSMVSMLDRLERDGFVSRAPSPTDRRVKLVRLTEAGSQVYDHVCREANQVRENLLAGFDAQALADVTAVLEALHKHIEAVQ